MRKLKIASLLLVCTLAVSIFPVTVSATSNYCQRLVSGNQCGKLLRWYSVGRSITYSASHKYGGIWIIGQSTCNYKYYISYKEYKCASGHIDSSSQDTIEFDHSSCGK